MWPIAFVFLAIGLALAYWIWPSGITDLTLSAITFGAVLRALASCVVVLVFFAMAVMTLS